MMTIFKLIAAAAMGAVAAAVIQEQRVRQAHFDPAFGMLTRAGVDARLRRLRTEVDVLFIDLDHIHDLNAQLGYAEVDRLICSAFQVRRGDTLLIGRWYSGDEIVVITARGDGAGLSERLTARLVAHGLSATIAVVAASPRHAIEAAAAQVQAAKAIGVRGQVITGEVLSCRS